MTREPDSAGRSMHLGAFLMGPGGHLAAWRYPGADARGGLDLEGYKRLAAKAEQGKFDMLFLSDSDGLTDDLSVPEVSRHGRLHIGFEPLTLLSALAAVTSRVGLIATASTTFNEPYHVARRFASLDLLSSGRAGWNVVTSSNPQAAINFSDRDYPDHASRYERAKEFVDVVNGLWNSWAPDFLVLDREEGVYFDPGKVHAIDHLGPAYAVMGPLTVPPSPQGRPIIVQAGSSEAGRDLAASTADVVFTAQQEIESARDFYDDLKRRCKAHGRSRDHLKILPGLFTVVAPTQEEAEQRLVELQSLIHPAIGMHRLEMMLGISVSAYPLDEPLPGQLPITNRLQSRQALLLERAASEKLTLRQLCAEVAGSRGHLLAVGSPTAVADLMEQWFTEGACDGFNVCPAYLPGGLDDFVDLVVPELQRRGLFRTDYEGDTLRENLGLPQAPSRWMDDCR